MIQARLHVQAVQIARPGLGQLGLRCPGGLQVAAAQLNHGGRVQRLELPGVDLDRLGVGLQGLFRIGRLQKQALEVPGFVEIRRIAQQRLERVHRFGGLGLGHEHARQGQAHRARGGRHLQRRFHDLACLFRPLLHDVGHGKRARQLSGGFWRTQACGTELLQQQAQVAGAQQRLRQQRDNAVLVGLQLASPLQLDDCASRVSSIEHRFAQHDTDLGVVGFLGQQVLEVQHGRNGVLGLYRGLGQGHVVTRGLVAPCQLQAQRQRKTQNDKAVEWIHRQCGSPNFAQFATRKPRMPEASSCRCWTTLRVQECSLS